MENVNTIVEETTLEAADVQDTVESTEGGAKETIINVAIKAAVGVGLFISGAIARPFIDKAVEKRKAKKAEKELEKITDQETEKRK